ncbi:imm11 family protein [Parasulfitobacter algicola]|uniref:Immunity MXAN-0049 protein domain-containing protein n=1 Tax=Parasulfitobacter algicola TaxID=2614809 RepID=A0ABX2ISY1_9RHOB|nr:DUF1629 domain-containing protein [Sulfitobacter algicola]NSX54190.1 hypothetical protein [Sulfitobacter algicola]
MTVWVSKVMMKAELIKPMRHDLCSDDEAELREAERKQWVGEPISAEVVPKKIWFMKGSRTSLTLPNVFFAYGIWVVSERVAQVLERFDMGQGALYPTQVFKKDQVTPMPGAYRCLVFGLQKNALRTDSGGNLVSVDEKRDIWRLRFVPKDNDVVVGPEVYEPGDIWMDPRLFQAFFLSDALAKALKAENVHKIFGLTKCKIV